MKKREFCIILGSALLAAGVSGCKESASKKYSSAQELINKGEYSEAVKKLREITSYEDSSQLLLYASANAAAVEGSFSEAITTLQSLGDYKDSQNLIVYYSAKQAEAQEDVYDIQYIASLYESIPLFRDSKEQEEAYLSGWYQTAVTDAEAENYAEAYPIFDNLGSYNDSDKMIDYYEARRLEAEGDYISMLKAKRVYDTMPQVVDCADRSSKILETLQTVYKDAQEKMKNGEYELALKEFESLGTYENSADLVDKLKEEIANQKLYKAAEDSLSKQDYSDAIKKFGELGSYADAKQRKEANDAYIIDAQSGGCRAVKDYEAYVDFVGKIPSYFATTDQTEDIIYHVEYNPSEKIDTLVWLNIKTGEDGIITSVNTDKEGYIQTDFICATTGQIVYLLKRRDTGKISLVTWKQDNDVWKQVSEIPLNESDSSRLFISDSGRGICCTSVETVVFDVNSEDVLYAIVGTEEKKQVTFQKATLEEAKKARENSRTFNIGTDCGISPDGKYMVFNRKMYEYDTERTYYNCEFINLDTAQVQEIENPATSNVEDILWLKNGNICLGDGIYSLD